MSKKYYPDNQPTAMKEFLRLHEVVGYEDYNLDGTMIVSMINGDKTRKVELKTEEGLVLKVSTSKVEKEGTVTIEASYKGSPVSATFESSNDEIATVGASTGVVTAIKPGKVTITAKYTVPESVPEKILEKSITFEITPKTLKISGEKTVEIGETLTLTAIYGSDDVTNTATWSIKEGDEVATVNKGVVTPVKFGTATVIVSYEDDGETYEVEMAITIKKPVLYSYHGYIVAGEETGDPVNPTEDLTAEKIQAAIDAGTLVQGLESNKEYSITGEEDKDNIILFMSPEKEIAKLVVNGTPTESFGKSTVTFKGATYNLGYPSDKQIGGTEFKIGAILA